MALDPDQQLDPSKIASREFSSSFRGYDADEVRTYLRQLADQIRGEHSMRPSADHDTARLNELLAERKELLAKITQLEADAEAAKGDVAAAVERAEAAEASSDPTTWDEARIDALVGAETAHVLEAARTAASAIRSRAEADAEARLKVAEERQRSTEEEIAEQRRSTSEEMAKLVADAEEKARSLATDSEAAAEKLLSDAKANAATSDEAAMAAANALRAEASAEAERVRAEAEAEAEAMRVDAEADVVDARDRAREETRLMLAEAQSVREKVLADLVKRRRTGRTQLDQIKAARDRMARSLAVVRRELDEAIDELAASVPEAKAAMEEVGRAAQSGPDERVVLELASELDRQRAREATEIDAVRVVDSVAEKPVGPPGSATKASVAASEGGKSLLVDDAAEATEPPSETTPSSTTVATTKVSTKPAPAAPVEAASGGERDDDDRVDEAAADAESLDESDSTASGEGNDEPKLGALFAKIRNEADPVDQLDEIDDEVVIDLDDDDDDQIDVPQVFMERDVAMTRFGPALRRQLKRALADDQSDVLDRVRQAKKQITLEDLPPIERQVLAFLDAVTDSLNGAARAGAEAAGDTSGAAAEEAVTELIERLASSVATPLRARVERSITEVGGDKEEVLEPIRANYRDTRSNDVPQLADDALAEAFAIGVYAALADNAKVVWLADPRHDPSPDCYDNALAGAVKKPTAFPTGLKLPLGGPGCRCLVVSEAMAKAQLVNS